MSYGINSSRGFTLIEVLVALVVATLGILAVTGTVLTTSRITNLLQEQSLAHFVAMNVATDFRLAPQLPDVGSQDGDAEFAGNDWRWFADISETQVEGLRRIEIRVAYAAEPDKTITDLVAFVSPSSPEMQFRDWTGSQQRRNLQAGP
ncbi:MAG: type II secretion system minor pseudopilin GspI [Gammaproteobacteria bacterium]|nr:type II secretion system minor pseudopilin GspI [Gammaproteobacteria bacterium]NND60223.1 type II secretion system minor pseudopilin GspI [Gammaproteobacteria bacterium]